jgi:hypothetical protein
MSLKVFFVKPATLEFYEEMAAQYILEQDIGSPAIQDNLPTNKMQSSLNEQVRTSRDDFLHVSFQEVSHKFQSLAR